MDVIRSSTHRLVKLARAAGNGRAEGLVLLEGDRLVDEAVRRQWEFEVVLVAEARARRASELAAAGVPVRLVDADLLGRVSQLVTSPGLAGLVREPALGALDAFAVDACTLVVVVAGIQDPGNLGALARTSEAAGARALVLLPGGCGPWNPKALRGSMGSLLRLPVLDGRDAGRVAAWFRRAGGRLVRAATRDGVPLSRFDWAGPVALWITGETGDFAVPLGCEDFFEHVTIEMAPPVESLNVSAAAAVLLFAAGRVAGGAP